MPSAAHAARLGETSRHPRQFTIAIALAAKAIESQRLPARVNDGVTEGLDTAATPSRDADLDAVIVFTTSLGGQTAAVVLTRVGEDDS